MTSIVHTRQAMRHKSEQVEFEQPYSNVLQY
jgi:hypothetical protein